MTPPVLCHPQGFLLPFPTAWVCAPCTAVPCCVPLGSDCPLSFRSSQKIDLIACCVQCGVWVRIPRVGRWAHPDDISGRTVGFPFSRPVSEVRALQQACPVPDGEPWTVSLASPSAPPGQGPQAPQPLGAGLVAASRALSCTGAARPPAPSLPCWQVSAPPLQVLPGHWGGCKYPESPGLSGGLLAPVGGRARERLAPVLGTGAKAGRCCPSIAFQGVMPGPLRPGAAPSGSGLWGLACLPGLPAPGYSRPSRPGDQCGFVRQRVGRKVHVLGSPR